MNADLKHIRGNKMKIIISYSFPRTFQTFGTMSVSAMSGSDMDE